MCDSGQVGSVKGFSGPTYSSVAAKVHAPFYLSEGKSNLAVKERIPGRSDKSVCTVFFDPRWGVDRDLAVRLMDALVDSLLKG